MHSLWTIKLIKKAHVIKLSEKCSFSVERENARKIYKITKQKKKKIVKSNKGRPPQDLRWGPYAVVEREHRPHYTFFQVPLNLSKAN